MKNQLIKASEFDNLDPLDLKEQARITLISLPHTPSISKLLDFNLLDWNQAALSKLCDFAEQFVEKHITIAIKVGCQLYSDHSGYLDLSKLELGPIVHLCEGSVIIYDRIIIDAADSLSELTNPESLSELTTMSKLTSLLGYWAVLNFQSAIIFIKWRCGLYDKRQRPKPKIPFTEPSPFVNGLAMVCTGAPMMSGVMALMEKRWLTSEDGEPRYRTQFKHGYIEHHIIPTDPRSGELTTFAKLTSWEIINNFDIYTAKLFLLMSMYAIKSREPWREEFALRGTDLIRLLHLDKRKDITKNEKLVLIRNAATSLSCLGVFIKWSQGHLKLSTAASHMWDITIKSWYADLFDEELWEIIIEARAGLWAKSFLNRAGQEEGTAVFQYSYLVEKILQIDPYRHPFAAKAMIYLTLQKQRQTFLVKSFLEKIIKIEDLAQAQQDPRKAHELIEQFDDFLLTANDLGFKIGFDDQTYPISIRPDFATEPSQAQHARKKRPKGFLKDWSKGIFTIGLPDTIPRSKETRPRVRVKAISSLTGNTIRQAREAKGLTVAQLSRKLSVSKMAVSYWESGKRRSILKKKKNSKKYLQLYE